MLDSVYLDCFTADLSPDLQAPYIHLPAWTFNLEVQ